MGALPPPALKLDRAPSTFAMVGFGKVCELEVDRERLRHLVGVVDRHFADDLPDAFYQLGFAEAVDPTFLALKLPVFDRKLSKFFNRVEEVESGLFLEDLAE